MSKTNIERSFVIPVIERSVRVAETLSLYRWVYWIFRRYGQRKDAWKDDELIPFWYAEVYALSFFAILTLLYFLVPIRSGCFFGAMVLAGYRLFDIGTNTLSIMLFEPKRRRDAQGGYILARDRSRWVTLTFVNLLDILVSFAFFHTYFGNQYEPILNSRVAGLYQSASAFIAGGGATPTGTASQILGLVNFLYFVLFFALAAPTVFSLVRAKERTDEQLGRAQYPDERL